MHTASVAVILGEEPKDATPDPDRKGGQEPTYLLIDACIDAVIHAGHATEQCWAQRSNVVQHLGD
jgi:hypothetical protein